MSIIESLKTCAKRIESEDINLKELLTLKSKINVTDKDMIDGVDRLIYNHSIPKGKIRDLLKSVSRPTLNKFLDKLEKENKICEPILQGKTKLYNRFDLKIIMEEFGVPCYRDHYTPCVISVINHKGGVGKSTTSKTLATGAALDLKLNAKVCLIDLDPQGSCGLYGNAVNNNDIYLTTIDMALKDHLENSRFNDYVTKYCLSDEEVVLGAALTTHLPNLDVYTAYPDDEIFTDVFGLLDDKEKANLICKLKDFILPILKTKYDIIIIDTAPQDSAITWSALEATDYLLMPITPHYLDFVSTKNFLNFITDRLKNNLPSKGENIKYFKAFRVNFDPNSSQSSTISDMVIRAFVEYTASNSLRHSELFLAADNLNRSVFDIKKTEAKNHDYASIQSYENAINSSQAVYEEFISDVKKISVRG